MSVRLIFIIICQIFLLIICFDVLSQTNAELINQETSIVIENDKMIKTSVYEVKINNRAGEKFSSVEIPYSKSIKIKKIEAFVKDKNGIIVKKLKKSDISERSAISDFSFYEDNFIKEFTLRHNDYPYTLSYTFQEQYDEFLVIDYWIPILHTKIPTLKASLKLEIPANYQIAYSENMIKRFKSDTTNALIKYIWETSCNKIFIDEIYSSDADDFYPYVKIVPINFTYDLPGSFRSWKEYANWQYELNAGLSELPQNEREKIKFVVDGVTDDLTKIKKLYHYLQDQTRYINIAIGTGGMKPYPASYVAINKYGDCKALSNYFISILDFIGTKAYYTKVSAGSQIRTIDKNFPSQQFNHIILFVPLENDTLWLDCTSNGPFNYLGTFTQNRDALVVDKDSGRFCKTPALKSNDVIESRTVHICPSENNVTADFENTYRGEKYELILEISNSYNKSKISQIIRNYFIEDEFDLIDYEIIKFDRDSAKIQLKYNCKSDKIYYMYGNDLLVKVLPFSIPKFEEPKVRQFPVQIDYPIFKIDTLKYEIPQGYSISAEPKNLNLESEFGFYKIEYFTNGNNINIIKSFQLFPGKYFKNQYNSFFSFMKEICELEKTARIITTKQ